MIILFQSRTSTFHYKQQKRKAADLGAKEQSLDQGRTCGRAEAANSLA